MENELNRVKVKNILITKPFPTVWNFVFVLCGTGQLCQG